MHTNASETAKARLLGNPREPLLFADWERVVFLHFRIAPDVLRPHIPSAFQLEQLDDNAWVSIVALTMRRFRAAHRGLMAVLARGLPGQQFLNFRTYVRAGNESGAYFLHGWLSRPWAVPWPSGIYDFPYTFADMQYEASPGHVCGRVIASEGEFAFRASPAEGDGAHAPSQFLLERYAGFFVGAGQPRVFHAWHPPWLQVDARAEIMDTTLVINKFPWFREARFAGAHYAQGFKDVWLGRLHRLDEARSKPRRVLSAFFDMP